MPVYGYRCTRGHHFEVQQRITEPPLTQCPECGAPVTRVFYPVGIIFKVTDQNFEATVGGAEQLVLLDFWATWCAPCKMLRPVVEELAAEYAGRVTVAELDVDANPQTASRFSVLSIPSLILFRGGKPADRIVGYKPKAYLKQKIDAVL